jgi:hypothetical protein
MQSRIYIDIKKWQKTEAEGALAVLKKLPPYIRNPQQFLGKEVRPLRGGLKKYKVTGVDNTVAPCALQLVMIPWPKCSPTKTKYLNFMAAYKTLHRLETETKKPMDMYECGKHWHIIVDQAELKVREDFMYGLKTKSRLANNKTPRN